METARTVDRSAPRAALSSGDTSRDGRGRIRAMPPILHYGFRPFFFLAGVYAGLAIPLWLAAYLGGLEIGGAFGAMGWHVHEMLFGYVAAVIAGFILTAIPNWTGRLPLSGGPLAMLVFLWLAGRLACMLISEPWLVMAIDLAFPAVLAFSIWREIVAGRNWKNAPVAVMITLFGLANAADHLTNVGLIDERIGQRLALAVIGLLIALIGGRIVPSFTRNWLVKERAANLPSPLSHLDKAALVVTAMSLAGWVAAPYNSGVGMALLAAGILLAARLYRWRGMATLREPILIVLHAGYGWLALAIAMVGLSILWPDVFPYSSAIHALTAGAVGTMTLAVMTRASLGHTGRQIVADRLVVAIYVLVTAGAVLRVAAPFSGGWYAHVLACGGGLWSAAFLLFSIRYAPILWRRRLRS
jgi:uncharacterized protein involved in response to NO